MSSFSQKKLDPLVLRDLQKSLFFIIYEFQVPLDEKKDHSLFFR